MKSVKLFNKLHGTRVNREYLNKLLQLAIDENQNNVVYRLKALLNDNPDDDLFEVFLSSETLPTVPQTMLNGIDIDDLNESDGLAKAVTPDTVYSMITNQIMELLSQPLEWSKEWGEGKDGYLIPYNFITKKPYRNVNALVLSPGLISQRFGILENPYFLTANQIKNLGGLIKKGEKSKQIIYYNFIYRFSDAEKGLEIKTNIKEEFVTWAYKNRHALGLKNDDQIVQFVFNNTFAFLKYYNVFNGSQVEGIDFDLDNFSLPGKLQKVENHHDKIAICEAIISAYPAPKVKLSFGGSRAFYSTNNDMVTMPELSQFKYVQAYYSTFFHELIHSTGAPSRLDREKGKKFGDKKYAYEELIAELGSVYLCAEAGILHYTIRNSAAYLKSWRSNLIQQMKKDNKFIFTAASKAQKAVDFMLQNFDYESFVKSQQKLKIEAKKPKKPAIKKSPKKPVEKPIKATEASKSFATKPKSISVQTAVNDVLTLPKFKGKVTPLVANLIYKNFKGLSDDQLADEPMTIIEKEYDKAILKNQSPLHYLYVDGELDLTSLGAQFVSAVNGRLQSLRNQKHNYAMFDGLKKPKPAAKKKPKALRGIIPQVVSNVITNAVLGDPTEVIPTEPAPAPVAIVPKPFSKNPKVQKIGAGNNVESVFFKIDGETGKFLQRVEKKPNHSVVITMDGEQGAGKTTTLFKFMNDFAAPGNKSLFISGEEDPSSELFKQKVSKYLSPAAQFNLDAVGDIETVSELYDLINQYDVIFIDSWQKLQRMIGKIRLDEDLRKKFDGKVFVVIFQQTTDGRTKGGAEVVFDGDIIIKMVKEPRFSDNYAYFDKNRYTLIDTADIRYNIASGTVYNPNETDQELTEENNKENNTSITGPELAFVVK